MHRKPKTNDCLILAIDSVEIVCLERLVAHRVATPIVVDNHGKGSFLHMFLCEIQRVSCRPDVNEVGVTYRDKFASRAAQNPEFSSATDNEYHFIRRIVDNPVFVNVIDE